MNKYMRKIKSVSFTNAKGKKEELDVWVDVYDVLKAFEVTCPAMAHALKKGLAPGKRGVKSSVQDKQEAIDSIKRSIELEQVLD